MLIQAGGSPRGIRASAYVADHVFGADMALAAAGEAARGAGRGARRSWAATRPAVGILWQTPIVVRETAAEAQAQQDLLLTAIPPEAVGAYLSYNAGYDFSTLPERFTLGELHAAIVASNASPAGLRARAGDADSAQTPRSPAPSSSSTACATPPADSTTIAGSAAQLADKLEEAFEATGSRGGFMLGHIVIAAERPGGDRRPAGPGTAAPRPLPHGIPLPHAAGKPARQLGTSVGWA